MRSFAHGTQTLRDRVRIPSQPVDLSQLLHHTYSFTHPNLKQARKITERAQRKLHPFYMGGRATEGQG